MDEQLSTNLQMEKIRRSFPGIPESALDFLTEEQEAKIIGLVESDIYVFVINVAFEPHKFGEKSEMFTKILQQAGEIVGCISSGFNKDHHPNFLYILASKREPSYLLQQLSSFTVKIVNARTQTARLQKHAPQIAPTDTLPTRKVKDDVKNKLAVEMKLLQDGYLKEFPDKIDSLNTLLGQLEIDMTNHELINELFRFIHSLKGSAGTYGFPIISKLASALEEVLARVRSGALTISPALCDLFYQWVDELQQVVEDIRSDCSPDEDNLPIIPKIKRTIADLSKEQTQKLVIKVSSVPHVKSLRLPHNTHTVSEGSEIRVAVDKVDSLINNCGELINSKTALHNLLKDLRKIQQRQHLAIRNWQMQCEQLCDDPSYARYLSDFSHFIQQANEILDRTMRDLHDITEIAEPLIFNLALLSEQFGATARKMRMLPLRVLFQRFPRMVRDISHNLGRDIDLLIHGQDAEMDKLIIEKLYDPLLHMVRNSIDHGIEAPEIRSQLGKPPKGTITLNAYNRNNRVIIEVRDDGAGMDVRKIGDQAIAADLVTQQKLLEMADREILEFIFAPGFTTKNEVTEISGRGVGMDVVRSSIENLQGQIDIHSQAGNGTVFIIQLPLTLSIIEGLLIDDNGSLYYLPSIVVEKVKSVSCLDLQSMGASWALTYRQQVLPVIPLRQVLQTGNEFVLGHYVTIVIVNDGQRKIGFIVDNVVESEEIVIKPLGAIMQSVDNVCGVTIRADGNLGIVLDAMSLLRNASHFAKEMKLPMLHFSQENSLSQTIADILVVDDSVTSREMIMDILQVAGFQVTGADNGLEAWEKLKIGTFDLVITDLDMPLVDGWELINKMRSSSNYALLPVIIITAHGYDEDIRRGLEVGANAYLVKQNFTRDKLLARVGELLGDCTQGNES